MPRGSTADVIRRGIAVEVRGQRRDDVPGGRQHHLAVARDVVQALDPAQSRLRHHPEGVAHEQRSQRPTGHISTTGRHATLLCLEPRQARGACEKGGERTALSGLLLQKLFVLVQGGCRKVPAGPIPPHARRRDHCGGCPPSG